ncbi:MAG: efflux RND transporter periplasmic adaptor subunit [Pseudomonadota bacterium]
MKRHTRIAAALGAIRRIGAFGVMSYLVLAGSAYAADQPMATTKVAYQTVVKEQVYDATIEAVHQATVSAETAGRIVEINYDVDDYVPQGAVIMRFESRQQKADVTAAQAALREQQARHEQAQADHQRISDLYARKLLPKADLDKAVAALKSSEERLKAVEARLQQSEEQQGYTVVRAPYSGIVTKRHVQVGEVARVGQPLMSGFSLKELRATTRVPQQAVDQIRRYNKARILLDDAAHTALPASKLTIYPFADERSHTFQVRVELSAGQPGIYPGMMVKAGFVTGEEQRLVVPAQAVAYRSEVTALYVIDNDQVKFRQVRLGKRLPDGMIEVLAGVSQDEVVALDPVQAAITLKQQRAGAE